jgi:peptidoglycan-N-acetylglucosamine deacetylase
VGGVEAVLAAGQGLTMPSVERRSRLRLISASALAAALAIVSFMVWKSHAWGSAPQVAIDGRLYAIAPNTTLSTVLRSHNLILKAGNLVSVNGHVLGAGVFAGHVLINRRPTAGDPVLRNGDAITLLPGHDRRERLVRTRHRVAGGEPSTPMFTLTTRPGYEIILKGRISSEIDSQVFHPTGPAHTPRAVALTFDDGPSPLDTLRILRVLRRLHAKATFFLIGRQAAAYPSIVKAELAAGMKVEDHSWDHPIDPPFARLSARRIDHEIAYTKTVIDRDGGRVTLFRPPGGSTSPEVEQIAQKLGCQTVLWSVDPRDWAPGTTSHQITHRVLHAARPGSIILLHDGGGNRNQTLKALPHIIRQLRARGLRLVTPAG